MQKINHDAVVVDFSHLFFRHLYANYKDVLDNPDYIAHTIMTSLLKIIREFKINKEKPLYLALDGKRQDIWRTEYYAKLSKDIAVYNGLSYKGHRVKDESVDWDSIFAVLEKMTDSIRDCTDIKIIKHPNAEADDVIYVATKVFENTTIISSDKDFKQLISENVKQYDPIKGKYIKLEGTSEDFLKLHLLLGDKSDGIHGIKKGWGPKTCEKNMKNLESFLETDDDMKARYNFNKIMIDMTEIPDEIVDEIKTLYNKSQPGYNNIKLLTFCRELRLVKIAEDVGKFRFK